MKINTLNLVYFSATYTTKKIVENIAKHFEAETSTVYDITQTPLQEELVCKDNDLLIIGVPVYYGRIADTALSSIRHLKGNNTPAVIVCVYGNRDYDDALLELKDMTEENGFKIISAGAFIARHCIFSDVATNRPDEKDMQVIESFGERTAELLTDIQSTNAIQKISVKGNHPYKTYTHNPNPISTNDDCTLCGTCAELCPTQSIDADNPKETNYTSCISCGRCIIVCPENARAFSGTAYEATKPKFTAAFSRRNEPELIYASLD